MIPLVDGTVISFINYEIKVELEKKDANEFEQEKEQYEENVKKFSETAQLASTMIIGSAAAE